MAYFISDFPPLLIKKASFVLISRASVYLRFLDSRFRLLPWDFYEVVNVIVKVCFVFYLFSLVSLDLFTFRSVEGKHFLDMRYTILHLLSIFNKCLANLIGNFTVKISGYWWNKAVLHPGCNNQAWIIHTF